MYKKVVMAVIGAMLAMSVGAAGAYFTAQVQVPDNVIKAGEVALSVEPTSAALSVNALAPGSSYVRNLPVKNTGTLSADVIITAVKKAGITEFYDALTCKVSSGGTVLYDGTLAMLRTTPLRIPAGATAGVSFEIGLPATAGNTLAGDYAKVSLLFDAEQVH